MIAIIQAAGFNLASVKFALQHLGYDALVTKDPSAIQQASHVILPGVGSARYAMGRLQADQLTEIIVDLKQPVLGLCLGLQLMYEHSHEGNIPCLGIFPGTIVPLPLRAGLSIPHMGWNQLQIKQPSHPLLKGIPDDSYVYFVHSYYAPVTSNTVAITDYSEPFTAVVSKNNFHATQFHPERSSEVGLKLIENFLNLGTCTK